RTRQPCWGSGPCDDVVFRTAGVPPAQDLSGGTPAVPMSMTEPKASLSEALEVLLRFGTLMLRAGDTAFRVRDAMGMLADSMGLDRLDLQVTLNSMTATVRRGEEYATLTREIAPIGINSWRIAELE